jgi:hypothetical protein
VTAEKQKHFNHSQYILDINHSFMTYGGSKTIAIPYDLPKDKLLAMLAQINGAFLTGGAIHMFNETTHKFHPYYQTAKTIIEYSKQMKDKNNATWPVLGSC